MDNGKKEFGKLGDEKGPRVPAAVYVEDAVILLSVIGLFLFTLERDKTYAKIGTVALLALMVIIAVRRITRFRKALKRRNL